MSTPQSFEQAPAAGPQHTAQHPSQHPYPQGPGPQGPTPPPASPHPQRPHHTAPGPYQVQGTLSPQRPAHPAASGTPPHPSAGQDPSTHRSSVPHPNPQPDPRSPQGHPGPQPVPTDPFSPTGTHSPQPTPHPHPEQSSEVPSLHLVPTPEQVAPRTSPTPQHQPAPAPSGPQPVDLSRMPPPGPSATPVEAPQAQPAPRATTRTPEVGLDHPAVARLFQLLNISGDGGYSDIHVHPGKPIRRLLRGTLEKAEDPARPENTVMFAEEEIQAWLAYATKNADDPFAGGFQCSPAIDTGRWRVRAAFRRSLQGLTCSFRVIPRDVPLPGDLGIPEHLQRLVKRKSGLVLVEGGTGSGKTTFNAAMVNKANQDLDLHIYTIEDPVEFVYLEHGNTTIVQREIGEHAESYPLAIEDALRSKPNIIVVGEMRNTATRRAALWAATTGHLVFTTAHSGSATEAIDTFIGEFPADEQAQTRSRLSQSLLAVVSQQLVPTVDGRLTAAREVLLNDMNFSELIRDGKTHMIPQQMAGTPGSFTMEDSLLALTESGRITPETAMVHAKNPRGLEDGLRRIKFPESKHQKQKAAA